MFSFVDPKCWLAFGGMMSKIKATAGSNGLACSLIPKVSKLCQILTDSFCGKPQVTITFWRYEVKGQSHSRLKCLGKHFSAVLIQKFFPNLVDLHGFFPWKTITIMGMNSEVMENNWLFLVKHGPISKVSCRTFYKKRPLSMRLTPASVSSPKQKPQGWDICFCST